MPSIPKGMRQSIESAISMGLRTMRTPEPLRCDQWIERHFYLSPEASYEEGPMRLYAFQRGIAQLMGNEEIEELWFRKSARVGYTKLLVAATQYAIEHRRRNVAIWLPSDEARDRLTKQDIDPAIRDNPAIRRIFPWFEKKAKQNTLALKQFVGAALHLLGGKAAKNFRAISVDVAVLDELDAFDQNIEREGPPVALAWRRAEGSNFKKLIVGSSPALRGISMIEPGEESCEVRLRWHIPCPHCGHEQPLQWGGADADYGFKWEGRTYAEAASTIHYRCEACKGSITEQQCRDQAAKAGRWMAEDGSIWLDEDTGLFRNDKGDVVDTPRRIGIHVWSAMNDRVPWSKIVGEWLDAQRNRENLQSFVNLTLGETWEEEGVTNFDYEVLHRTRREHYEAEVPEGVVAITFGVDTQDDRFEIQWDGWGAYEERWSLDYQVINGDPSKPTVWQRLREVLQRQFRKADGTLHDPILGCMDYGGHYSREVAELSRDIGVFYLIPIVGSAQHNKPIVNWPKKRGKYGAYLVTVGTDTGKTLMQRRMLIDEPGPGFWHWPRTDAFGKEYFKQLTAEEMRPKHTPSGRRMVWQMRKGRTRNEPWDCSNYSLAAIRIAQERMGIALDNPDSVPAKSNRVDASRPRKSLAELAKELNDG